MSSLLQNIPLGFPGHMPHLITSENDTRKNSQQPQEIHDKFLQDYSLKKKQIIVALVLL